MSTTVTVSNSVQLAAAIKASATTKTPETILLQAGTYSVNCLLNYNPSANVTIQSANSSNKAVLEGLNIQHSSNFTFNDLTFTTLPGRPTGDMATGYYNNNVNFTNDSFIGQSATSYASAATYGLVIGDSTKSTVSNNTFEYVQNGIGEKENTGITMSNNSFANIYGDGIDNAASSNVNILNNSFTNLHIDNTDAQHSDAIQFWTSGEKTAGSNITIEGNTYNIGTGQASQGIFMTDQVGGLSYSNVTIENNDLVGTGWNGVTLQHVTNAVVQNNILQSVASTGQISRLTLDGGVSGLIQNNQIGQLININGNSATVSGNSTLPSIPLSLAAQALVSGMASIASSATAGTAVPSLQLATTNGFLAGHPIAIPQA
jgi:hypothetical protein